MRTFRVQYGDGPTLEIDSPYEDFDKAREFAWDKYKLQTGKRRRRLDEINKIPPFDKPPTVEEITGQGPMIAPDGEPEYVDGAHAATDEGELDGD